MTLQELSREYRESARLLRDRLAYLRRQLKQTDDPAEVWRLNRRIADLQPMYSEMKTLAELTERYYERGYYRDERYSANAFHRSEQGKTKSHIV